MRNMISYGCCVGCYGDTINHIGQCTNPGGVIYLLATSTMLIGGPCKLAAETRLVGRADGVHFC